MERREGHFISKLDASLGSHAELFYQTWLDPKATRTLIITHGLAEHSDCYTKTADALGKLGWNVIAWDLRGHGRSEGKRGFVEDFEHYARDLSNFLLHLRQNGHLERPFALIGHSMGGLITLRYLVDQALAAEKGIMDRGPVPRAVALSSPLLGLALEVPKVKELAAKVLGRIMPTITLYNEIRYEDLTRDTELLKGYGSDALRHDKISPALYMGMLKNIEYVRANAAHVTLPILIQAAGKEKIVSRPAIEETFPLIGSENKKLIIYDESYHEIFNDLDREQVFRELDAFLKPIVEHGS